MSKIRLHGSSSGYTEIAPVAASGNNTLTLPNDGTIISKDSAGAIGITSVRATNAHFSGLQELQLESQQQRQLRLEQSRLEQSQLEQSQLRRSQLFKTQVEIIVQLQNRLDKVERKFGLTLMELAHQRLAIL